VDLFISILRAIDDALSAKALELPPLPLVEDSVKNLSDVLGLPNPAQDLRQQLRVPQLSVAARKTWLSLQEMAINIDGRISAGQLDQLVLEWLNESGALSSGLAQLAKDIWGNEAAIDQLIGRVLQVKYPRLAAAAMLLDILRAERGAEGLTKYTLDRQRLDNILNGSKNNSGGINDTLLDELRVAYGVDEGTLAAIFAMLTISPRAISALNRRALKAGALPLLLPSTDINGNTLTSHESFRNATKDWVSVTLPFKASSESVGGLVTPTNSLYFSPDLDPERSLTLAFRSRTYQKSGTDYLHLEAWLDIAWQGDKAKFRFLEDTQPIDWPWDMPMDRWPWVLTVEPSVSFGLCYSPGSLSEGWAVHWDTTTHATGEPPDNLRIALSLDQGVGRPDLTIGPPFDNHIRIGDLQVFAEIRQKVPVLTLGLQLTDFEIVISSRWWRMFGQADPSLRDGIRLRLDGRFAYAFGRGFEVNNLVGLQTIYAIEKAWAGGAFVLHSITFRGDVRFTAPDECLDWRVAVTAHFSFKLGPVVIVIAGVGIAFGDWESAKDEVKLLSDQMQHEKSITWAVKDNYAVFFIPPHGLGVQIEVGPVKGGGYVDFKGGPTNKFAGVLHLSVALGETKGFAITALGIHELSPTGGTTILGVLGVKFTPGILLSQGLFITGLGGLFGHDRRCDLDAMRFRLSTGSVGRILSLEDPIRNAPTILDDLDAFFPAADGVTVLGLTMRLTWMALVNFDIALIFEIARDARTYGTSGLTKIVILGSAAAKSLVKIGNKSCYDLQMDIMGFIDFVDKEIEIHAVLVRSSLMLGLYQITGDVLILARWGNARRSFFLFSLGGFHPSWSAPVALPTMARVGVSTTYGIDSPELRLPGINGLGVWLRGATYLAITTNTLQLGQRIELGVRVGYDIGVKTEINFYGFFSYDAIIYFDPFWFEVTIEAAIVVRVLGNDLYGVSLLGQLSGPNPMKLRFTSCFRYIFKICLDQVVTFIKRVAEVHEYLADLDDALLEELSKSVNLFVHGVKDTLAVLKGEEPVNVRVVTPAGELVFKQSLVPLRLQVSKLHGKAIRQGTATYVLEAVTQNLSATIEPIYDAFAPGSFTTLDKSEALNRPAFEELQSGIRVAISDLKPAVVSIDAEVDTHILPKNTLLQMSRFGIPDFLLARGRGRTADRGEFIRTDPVWKLKRETWQLGSQIGLSMSQALELGRHAVDTPIKPEAESLVRIGGL
jgi:hypothetical protein